MIIFGGIYEITKELNDLHIFDFAKRKWVTVFEESVSPGRNRDLNSSLDGDTFHATSGLNASGS